MEFFEVGGCIRDEILGIPSKDIDFSVVMDPSEVIPRRGKGGKLIPQTPFEVMDAELQRRGFRIWKRDPEFFTIRAQFPKPGGNLALIKNEWAGLDADFVLSRRDGEYTDNRRPDSVELGTLHDDLARRDFTMNAIAKDAQGNLIDPFGGQEDIADRIIRAVGDARQRIIAEDALRGMRALRFSIQKDFDIDDRVALVLLSQEFREALGNIAIERVQGELEKMFAVSTVETLQIIRDFRLENTLFSNTGLRLMPTMKG